MLKKLAGQTVVYGLSSIVGRLLNYLLVPIHTRIFAESDYGMVTELYSYVAFFTVLYTYGMETAYFRHVKDALDKEHVYQTAMWSLLGSSALMSGLLFSFAQPIAEWLQYPEQALYVRWFALILALDAVVALPFARLRLEERPLRFAVLRLVNILVNIGLNIFFLILCPHYPTAAWSVAIYDPSMGIGYIFLSNLIASIVTVLLLLPQFLRLRFHFDKVLWLQMLAYSLPLLVVGFAGTINEMLDRVLFRHLYPGSPTEAMTQLGIYGANYRLCIIMSLFTQAYRFAAEPFFFAQSAQKNAPQIYARAMHYFVLAGLMVCVGVPFFMDIIQHFIGKSYRTGLGIVPILLFSHLLLGIYYNLSVWYKLTNKTVFGAYISLSGAFITILLNMALVPIMSYWGAAIANFVCYALMTTISYYFGKKYYPIPYTLAPLLVYSVGALLLVLINQFLLNYMPIFPAYFIRMLLLGGALFWIFKKEKKFLENKGKLTP